MHHFEEKYRSATALLSCFLSIFCSQAIEPFFFHTSLDTAMIVAQKIPQLVKKPIWVFRFLLDAGAYTLNM